MSETFLTRMASSGPGELVQAIVQYSSAETMQAFNETAAAAEVGIGLAMVANATSPTAIRPPGARRPSMLRTNSTFRRSGNSCST